MNRIDFALVIGVKNANPNGDPLNGNRPRQIFGGKGEISDVCLKRKIRNRLLDAGESVLIQSNDYKNDNFGSIRERVESAKLPQGDEASRKAACEKWLDVRSFGQVFAFKKSAKKGKNSSDGHDEGEEQASVSIGVRGPVTIQAAYSLEPITITSEQITKSVNGEPTETGKKASDTMGMKHRVDSGVYVAYGSISVQLAERTGFTEQDAEKIKSALENLFQNDESSARPAGSVNVLHVVWWKHSCKRGNHSVARVHRSLAVNNDGSIETEELDGVETEVYHGVV
ncbi:type I-C CRISPR-associated protein Cas7/Csd2 [Clostridia bacterium]|nr:type I-C CRISPR-associated protein Cas7/Csd2 [Clostridia bacterium]